MMLITLEKGETRHINPSHVVFAYESDGPFGHYLAETVDCTTVSLTQESYERIVKWMEEQWGR